MLATLVLKPLFRTTKGAEITSSVMLFSVVTQYANNDDTAAVQLHCKLPIHCGPCKWKFPSEDNFAESQPARWSKPPHHPCPPIYVYTLPTLPNATIFTVHCCLRTHSSCKSFPSPRLVSFKTASTDQDLNNDNRFLFSVPFCSDSVLKTTLMVSY